MPEILYTPRYEDDLVRIYKYSARKWGRSVAERTLKQIAEVEQAALADPDFGKMDAQYYSAVFRHAIVKNSQTVFFHRLGDRCGDDRSWIFRSCLAPDHAADRATDSGIHRPNRN